jgi:hypothetical protein
MAEQIEKQKRAFTATMLPFALSSAGTLSWRYRMTRIVLALSIAAALLAQQATSSQAGARPADVSSMDAIVATLYDVISGPAGQARDWDRMRSLFVPGGRLIPSVAGEQGGATARVLDVNAYIERVRPNFERNGFFEREIARKTEAFGNIAHLFSTYESRHAPSDAAPFARGINSIQLLKDGDRWWVVTVFWDAERQGNALPAQYLPKK